MTIRAISRQDFDSFVTSGDASALVSRQAVEWYADDAGVVVGVIAYDESDFDSLVLVLRRDHAGTFRSLGTDVCLRDRDDARGLLLARMRTALRAMTAHRPVWPMPPAHKCRRTTRSVHLDHESV
jgi:hypothetical protein